MKFSQSHADIPRKRWAVMPFALIFFTLQFSSCPIAAASPSECAVAAENWISTLPHLDNSERERLKSYTQRNCSFAARWQREKVATSDQQRQKRTCYDLVLVWTHKECIYFRDYITAAAYDPCKNWSRQMFQQCMAGNIDWFLTK